MVELTRSRMSLVVGAIGALLICCKGKRAEDPEIVYKTYLKAIESCEKFDEEHGEELRRREKAFVTCAREVTQRLGARYGGATEHCKGLPSHLQHDCFSNASQGLHMITGVVEDLIATAQGETDFSNTDTCRLIILGTGVLGKANMDLMRSVAPASKNLLLCD